VPLLRTTVALRCGFSSPYCVTLAGASATKSDGLRVDDRAQRLADLNIVGRILRRLDHLPFLAVEIELDRLPIVARHDQFPDIVPS